MQNYFLRNTLVGGLKPTEEGWLWPEGDDGLWDGPKENWEQFKPFIQQNISGNKVVVQAGGACGVYPFLLSHMFDTVYTFEPSFINFHCLVHNTPKERIIKLNTALGQAHEMVKVNYDSLTNVGTNTVKMEPNGFVPTLLIDDLDLAACNFIQLDVEGYEYEIILGAIHTIKRFRPLVSLENGDGKNILDIMTELGYANVGKIHADTYWKPL